MSHSDVQPCLEAGSETDSISDLTFPTSDVLHARSSPRSGAAGKLESGDFYGHDLEKQLNRELKMEQDIKNVLVTLQE
ncbi:hypothetical protein cypCar_00033622 [Cyprinus carpio]|nr:hypothetical protein cypCar_00033622 [Cyprinus carpio]